MHLPSHHPWPGDRILIDNNFYLLQSVTHLDGTCLILQSQEADEDMWPLFSDSSGIRTWRIWDGAPLDAISAGHLPQQDEAPKFSGTLTYVVGTLSNFNDDGRAHQQGVLLQSITLLCGEVQTEI